LATLFTQNYRDHSTEMGFQFEFFCDRCRSGHRSAFRSNKLGVATSVIKAASALFGGASARAGWGADHVKDAFRGPAWDAAYRKAIDECRSRLSQCTRCAKWVCSDVCWNQDGALCQACAPTSIASAAGAPASATHTCASCQAPLAEGAKFCTACGTAAKTPSTCATCNSPLSSGARFCAGCGKPAT
jgi:hypothetical protein